jgi:HAD superfamily hydrolase (TIGR01509 family)
MSGRIQAVVFDFDGLLADSEPLQVLAWEEFLARHGKRLEPSLLHDMFGLRVRDSSELVRDRLELPMTPTQVMTERDEIFLDLVERELVLFPAAAPLIRELRENFDLKLALATSGHRRYIEVAMRVAGLDDAFDVSVNGDDVERGKPDPEMYLAAAAKLGVAPRDCVALEDAPHGVRSAKAAGMCCLAVPNEMTRELPGLEHADAILGGLDQVVPWLTARDLLQSRRRAE